MMSPTFCYNGVCYSADKGNDGDTYTADVHRTCLVTYTEKHPWWVVDLTVPLYVDSVDFTNRGDNTIYGESSFLALYSSSLSINVNFPICLSLCFVCLFVLHLCFTVFTVNYISAFDSI